jgi:GT2 family glycosyltransferase
MKEKNVFVLSRPQLLDTPNNTFFQQAVSLARESWIGHGRDSTIYSREDKYVSPSSSGASYRREVFDKVGYFDPSFDACEDVEFNHRCEEAGFHSYTSMDLTVCYYPRSSLYALFRQMMRYGMGRYRLACKHPQTLSLTTLFPSFLVVGLILPTILGVAWPPFFFLSGGLAALYLGIVLACSFALARRHGWAYFFVLPGVYWALHLGLGWGFLREMGTSLLRKVLRM